MNTPVRAFRFGPFRFDTAQQELRRHTRRVHLSVSLLRLLTLFLSRHGELITREEIALTLWEDTHTIDIVTGINTAVRRLRAQLDDDPNAPTYIETVIGIGYRFIAHVEVEAEDAGDARVPLDPQYGPAPIGESVVVEARDPGALTSAPASELLMREKDRSPGPQQFVEFGRHRFLLVVGAALVLLALSAAVLGAVMAHRPKPVRNLVGASHLSPSFFPITFRGQENRVTAEAISPDGHLVAYSDRYGVSIHPLSGGADRLLSSPSSFLANRIRWHPGNDWILVSGVDLTSKRSEAWALFLEGETPRLLVEDAGMAEVSPDGGHIAFTRRENSELWLADGIGQNAHLLVPKVEGESFTCLLWSPQGDRLVADRVSPLSLPDPAHLDTSATSFRSTYESFDIRSGKLLSRQENVRFNSGFLLKDGRFLFLAAEDFEGTKVMLVNTDPTTGEFLTSPQPASRALVLDVGGDSNALSASTNGDWIGAVLTSRSSDVYVAELHWPGPTLGEPKRLTDRSNNYPHAWTPDGDAVLFDRNDPTPVIAKQRLGDGKLEIVAQLPDTAAMAAFSPDGKWILFTEFAGSPSRAIGIFSMPSGGGKPRQLATTGVVDDFLCPTSDRGSCVVRETSGEREFVFYALDPTKGMQQEVGRTGWSPTMLGDWSVSPDGSTVAMANHDPENPGIRLIHLSPHRSRQPSTIKVPGFGEVREATWSPDAKGLFVETKTVSGYNLLYVDLEGHARLLRQSSIAIWGIPSRDGKKLAFPSQTIESNVWAGQTALQ